VWSGESFVLIGQRFDLNVCFSSLNVRFSSLNVRFSSEEPPVDSAVLPPTPMAQNGIGISRSAEGGDGSLYSNEKRRLVGESAASIGRPVARTK